MKHGVAALLKHVEGGMVDRRRFLKALGLTATAGFTVNACDGAGPNGQDLPADTPSGSLGPLIGVRTFPATTINHLSYAASDYAKIRDFYVDLFGMTVTWDDGQGCALEFGDPQRPNGMYVRKVAEGQQPNVTHLGIGVVNFLLYKDAIYAEMIRRQLEDVVPDGEHGWILRDPGGYLLDIIVEKSTAMFPGAAICDLADSEVCRSAYASGRGNLASAPKPSGTGFRAYAFSHIVLNTPDVPKAREFYENMLGMHVIYDQPAAQGRDPQVFLRFGENALILRQAAEDAGPSCHHFGLAIHDYDPVAVEAELGRRGLDPEPDSKMAWTIMDPDGLRVEVAAYGYPEHIGRDCGGSSETCPAAPG